jgi:hypothetical protein
LIHVAVKMTTIEEVYVGKITKGELGQQKDRELNLGGHTRAEKRSDVSDRDGREPKAYDLDPKALLHFKDVRWFLKGF